MTPQEYITRLIDMVTGRKARALDERERESPMVLHCCWSGSLPPSHFGPDVARPRPHRTGDGRALYDLLPSERAKLKKSDPGLYDKLREQEGLPPRSEAMGDIKTGIMADLRTAFGTDFAARAAAAGCVDVMCIGQPMTGATRDPAIPVVIAQRDVSDDVAERWLQMEFLTRYKHGAGSPCFVVVKRLWGPQETLTP